LSKYTKNDKDIFRQGIGKIIASLELLALKDEEDLYAVGDL